MLKIPVYDLNGKETSQIDLKKSIFSAKINENTVKQTVLWQQACARRGTASTKTIGEVSGGGVKPWRQKGTGRARAGSIRSPLWRGGGITFGPKPRNYKYKINKKVKLSAITSVLTEKFNQNKIKVVESISWDSPKTKNMVELLSKLELKGKVLFVTDTANKTVVKSARNIPWVKTIDYKGLNVADVMKFDQMLFTREALLKVQERIKL